MFEFASALGLVQGRNPYLTIKGFEERKFNRKEFKGLMLHDPTFRDGVIKALRPYYFNLLGEKKDFNKDEGTSFGDIDLEEMEKEE